MRAVRYHEHGGPDVLSVETVDRPDPDPDEILMAVHAASVNPVDVMLQSGEYGEVTPPATPGGDGAGVVECVGERVDCFEEGDHVFVSGLDRARGGTFAEYAAVPVSKAGHLPDGVSMDVGGAIGNVGTTAWTALTTLAETRPGDRVLVHGAAGGVGHLAVQIASQAGAEVVGTAGSPEARERVREFGASAALDYDSDTLAADVLEATDGAGVETVLDHRLGQYLDLDLEVLAEGGRVVAIMGELGEADARAFYGKEATLQALRMDTRPERRPMLRRLARLLARGDLTAVVDETYELTEAARAQQAALAGGYVGKVVVTP